MDPRLQQLRDLELPADPSWWPPAVGWWMVAMLLLALVGWGLWMVIVRNTRQRPYRRARRELDALRQALQRGAIDARQYVDGANALLKRVCIHARRDRDVARLSDVQWLRHLDALSGGNAFTQGSGSVLGARRFAPRFELEAEQLHRLLTGLLGRLEASA
jgi:hypothetical protein